MNPLQKTNKQIDTTNKNTTKRTNKSIISKCYKQSNKCWSLPILFFFFFVDAGLCWCCRECRLERQYNLEGAPHASAVYLDQCYCFPLHSIRKLAYICICIFDTLEGIYLYLYNLYLYELFSVATIILIIAEEMSPRIIFFSVFNILHHGQPEVPGVNKCNKKNKRKTRKQTINKQKN